MRKMSDELLANIRNYIEAYVDDHGFPPSVRDICDGLHIKSTATVYKYVNKLSELGYLKKADNKNRAINVSTRLNKNDFSAIPLVGKIAAGTPITAIENVEDTYDIPTKMFSGDELFMLTVEGTSMIDAGIFNGDKVILQQTSVCENGDIVAAMIDDSATVKRFYKEKDHVRLHPENPTMQDIIVDDCVILGKVIGLIRKF